MKTKNKRYFAFISYKSEDVEWAIWLQHELEHYHLPASFNGRNDVRQDLRPVFRDIDELKAGNLTEQIQQALTDSENLIVICSPQSAKSHWVNEEVETFISLGRIDTIFPFIVEGNSPKDFFCPALLALPKEQERLGGEVSKNGRDAAFVKVVAGMLNVEYDSLWNRYEKEKAEQERFERERKENLLRLQSRFIAEKAIDLTDNGDSYLAQRILLEVLPQDLENLDRPYTPETEIALRKAIKTPSAILYGHNERVNCAVFSPDGRTIISGGEDNRIRIWDARTGKEIQEYHRHSNGIDTIVFSPDGKQFVTIASDSLNIWDAESKQILLQKKDIYPRVEAVAFNPEGTKIAMAQGYNIVILDIETLDIETGLELYITGHTGPIHSIAYSPDGKYIVSDALDDDIHVWDAVTGRLIKRIEGYNEDYCYVSYSPDGKHIIVASSEGNIYILDAQTGEEVNKLTGHTDVVNHASFSPDGTYIVSASWDKTIRIWEAQTGKEFKKIEGHTSAVRYAVYSPDGKCIVSASDDKTVRIWQVNPKIGYHSVEEGKMIGTGKCTLFSKDGKRIISISYSDYYDNIIQIWDAKTGIELKRLIGHERTINSFALGPNGLHIASASSDKTICIWNIDTGELLMRIKGHEGDIYAVAFSPNGTILASAANDETIRIWDSCTGNETIRIETNEEYIPSLTFSPDGKHIAAASFMFIQIWDVETGKERNRIDVDSIVNHIAYSPDGQYLAAASHNEIIRLWNATTGELVAEMKGHEKGINYIAFSPDGKYLVSASEDTTAKIWNVETGVEIITLDQDSGRVFCASFSPDGERVITAPDEEIRIWDFPSLQAIINQTRARYKDYPLTPEERKKYYLD